MKADLAIYSLIVGMSGQWLNAATMLNNKLDFYCCDNSIGFCKSSHIYNIHMHMLINKGTVLINKYLAVYDRIMLYVHV